MYVPSAPVASHIDQDKLLRGGASNPAYGQYLEGGETQLYVDFAFAANQHAKAEVAALPKLDTNWMDHMNINIPERGATVQKLASLAAHRAAVTRRTGL